MALRLSGQSAEIIRKSMMTELFLLNYVSINVLACLVEWGHGTHSSFLSWTYLHCQAANGQGGEHSPPEQG